MIANFAALDIKPGSMGVPLPGIEAAILRHEEAGRRRPSTSRWSRANWR
jgi:acetyl-CoA synthetase